MRQMLSISVMAVVLGVVAAPAAHAQQTVNFFIGGFTPRSFDARGTDDVLFQDGAFFSTLNRTSGIDISEFNGVTVGGEYLVGLGPNLEAGLGLSFYQKSVATVFTNFVNANGSEIDQSLKLRIVPFTATVRVLPLGQDSAVQPYVGAGVGVLAWRYSETGQFVDNTPQRNIFIGNFVGSGVKAGPVVLGGVRLGIGSTMVGGEVRWQGGKATLPPAEDFAGPKIDLGGFNYLFTVGFRF